LRPLRILLWAFSKSSLRFHRWLFDHPTLGRTIRAWHEHGVIPLRAKLMAVSMMAMSLTYVSLYVAESWTLPLILGMVLTAVASFIVTRPSRVPVKN